MDSSQLHDLRQRVLKVQALKAANEPIPDGLAPTRDELREALLALRSDRSVRTVKAEAKKESTAVPLDLNKLFGG